MPEGARGGVRDPTLWQVANIERVSDGLASASAPALQRGRGAQSAAQNGMSSSAGRLLRPPPPTPAGWKSETSAGTSERAA
jgi:hypothetical protein